MCTRYNIIIQDIINLKNLVADEKECVKQISHTTSKHQNSSF